MLDKDKVGRLHEWAQTKFDNAEGEDAPYWAGYMKALEDIAKLI